MDNFIKYAGFLIGLIGLIAAFLQYRKSKSLKEFIRANNWFNYQRMSNTNGTVQLALKEYKSKHSGDYDLEIIELLSKSDAHGQEIVKETIRSIQMHEPSFSDSDFTRWKDEGKIDDVKVQLFKRFMIS